MPIKMISNDENNPNNRESSRIQMNDSKRKNNIHRNEIVEEFVNSGLEGNHTIVSA